jgi:hypothetical protein
MQQPPTVVESACMCVGVEGPRGHHGAVMGHEACAGHNTGAGHGAALASTWSKRNKRGRLQVLYVLIFSCESYFMHYGSTEFQKNE